MSRRVTLVWGVLLAGVLAFRIAANADGDRPVDGLLVSLLTMTCAVGTVALGSFIFLLPVKARLRYFKEFHPQGLVYTAWRSATVSSALRHATRSTEDELRIPYSFALAADRYGFSLWVGHSDPFRELARFSWAEVIGVTAGTAQFNLTVCPALLVTVVGDAGPVTVALPLAGSAFWGLGMMTKPQVERVAAELRRIRPSEVQPLRR